MAAIPLSPDSALKRLLLALGATALALLCAPLVANDTVGALLAIGAIFIGLPATILFYRDLVRTRALRQETPSVSTRAAALPIRLLGVVSVVFGTAILLWVGYNLLIDRQDTFSMVSPLQLGMPVLLIFAGLRWLRRPVAPSDGVLGPIAPKDE